MRVRDIAGWFLVLVGQVANGRSERLGQRRLQMGRVAVDATDLLDQVHLASDVVMAMNRHDGLDALIRFAHVEPEPLEVSDLVGLRDLHPQQALGAAAP